MADSNDFEHFDLHQQTAQRKYQDRKRNCGSDMEEEKPKPMKTKDRNVCGSKSIVVLYTLFMATSMVWMILLSKAFAKHSEISAEIENLRNSRTILKGNDSAIFAELQELRNTLISLKASDTKRPSDLQAIQKDVSSLKTAETKRSSDLQALQQEVSSLKTEVTEEIQNLRVEQTLLKEKDSKITTNVTNLEKYVSKVCIIKTCPCEWTLFSGKCYYFSNENRDWKKAREFCQSQDSDLTVINSDEELNYLKGKVRVVHLVGMSDLETEGVWKWLDGSLVDGRMWNPGEPNNQGKEDCGEMSNGKLNDIPCNLKQRWICEKTL
ncbi:CD209 antigen-like protein C [Acipenser ruthenus]|uniref:CD209 antigen-like protein C n=1 Tax=Acipenser ruthenus TaxID=7906 RepID=UPI002742494F|nr:CD209 antigen-like protein C [Acipenser ruthenus]